MNEVSREEFDNLKSDVETLKRELENSKELLTKIDKKLDVISEKFSNSREIEELKLKPLEKRVEDIEDNNKWIWRTVTGAILGIIINGIVTIKNLI